MAALEPDRVQTLSYFTVRWRRGWPHMDLRTKLAAWWYTEQSGVDAKSHKIILKVLILYLMCPEPRPSGDFRCRCLSFLRPSFPLTLLLPAFPLFHFYIRLATSSLFSFPSSTIGSLDHSVIMWKFFYCLAPGLQQCPRLIIQGPGPMRMT